MSLRCAAVLLLRALLLPGLTRAAHGRTAGMWLDLHNVYILSAAC